MRHRTCGRACVPQDDESGFTLVEAVVALFVLGVIFTALAAASMGSLRASLTSRAEQQAIDFATQALETARSADYYTLANVSTDMVGDARAATCGATTCVNPGTGNQEPLVLAHNGSIAPHVRQVDKVLANNVTITLSTYITRPADTTADYKRVTVIANWSIAGHARERAISSLVTMTTRGLPLPVFKLTPLGGTSASVNPDAQAPFGLELTNQGAPDRWNLAFSGTAPTEWALYRDNGDGLWDDDPAIDIPLTNTNAPDDALLDTGRIDPTASIVFWAVRTVPVTTAAGDYWSALTATSAAQAGATTGTATVDLLVRVVPTGTAVEGNPGGGSVGATPGAPENLQLTVSDGQLKASWRAPASVGTSAITDYVVTYKLKGADTWTTVNDGVSATPGATITDLTNGSTYVIAVAAKNAAGLGALTATAEGTPSAGNEYIAPIRCVTGAPVSGPTASNGGYSLVKYSLHNRSAANPTWPGTGIPAATSTIGQGLPLSAASDGPQVAALTNLPVYSSNIEATEPGRIVLAGGSLTSTDTTRVIDWRSGLASKSYKGRSVLELWVAPVTGDTAAPMTIAATIYWSNGTNLTPVAGLSDASAPTVSVMDSTFTLPADTFGATGCEGWLQVQVGFDDMSVGLKANQYIGVRVWNPAAATDLQRWRVAYDMTGDFPSYLTVPEK